MRNILWTLYIIIKPAKEILSKLEATKESNQKTIPSEGIKDYKSKNLVSMVIFSLLMAGILLIESIFTLISVFWKGIFKKEVLSTKSELGFDIDIIPKP